MLILEGDSEIHLLPLERPRLLGRQVDLELLAALEAMTLCPHGAVDPHGSRFDQPLGGRAGADLVHLREKAVEALAGRLVRDV
jgi:hypothetical protein